jgi:hypothetical protein
VKQWEIWEFPFPTASAPHMFVILSPTRLCEDANFESVNGLLCTTVRPLGRAVKPHEVFLDAADGLDWLTSARCNIIFHFAKSAAGAVVSVKFSKNGFVARWLGERRRFMGRV